MEIPDNELDDLDQLLRHVHGYLAMAMKYQMHPDETKRLCEKTLAAAGSLDARRKTAKEAS
jgi:hypothetical protein